MIDTTQLIYEAVTAASPLQTLILGRAWSPTANAGFAGNVNAIVYHPENETSHPTGAMHKTVFTFKCYGSGGTHTSARTVYRALWDRLQHLAASLTEGRILGAELVTATQLPPDPDTGYPAHLAKFLITINEG